MKRITGIASGLALAGSLGLGVATSAQAAPASAPQAVLAPSAGEKAPCTFQYIGNRGIKLKCSTAAPGTKYRAWSKCKKPNGSTYIKVGPWKRQGSGVWSISRCNGVDKRLRTNQVGQTI